MEERINLPSTPLNDIGEGGPPAIVDVAESYSAVEGTILFRWIFYYNLLVHLCLIKLNFK